MIYTKANLSIHTVAMSTESRAKEFQFLHLEKDGASFATDGTTFLVCSPSESEEGQGLYDGMETEDTPEVGVNLRPDLVKQVLRSLPRELPLQNAVLSQCDSERVKFAVLGKGRIHHVEGIPLFADFPNWRDLFSRAMERIRNWNQGGGHRGGVTLVLPRRKLLRILQAMEEGTSDRVENSPVILEIGGPLDPVVLRTRNFVQKQDLLGLVLPLDMEAEALGCSFWTKMVLGLKKRLARRRTESE